MHDIDHVMLNFSPESLTILNGVLAIVMFSIALDLRLADFRALSRAPKPHGTTPACMSARHRPGARADGSANSKPSSPVYPVRAISKSSNSVA